MNISPVYVVKVIGFYKLRYCSSNGTMSFSNISLLHRTLAFTASED